MDTTLAFDITKPYTLGRQLVDEHGIDPSIVEIVMEGFKARQRIEEQLTHKADELQAIASRIRLAIANNLHANVFAQPGRDAVDIEALLARRADAIEHLQQLLGMLRTINQPVADALHSAAFGS
ncbi:hypothetical protein [Desertimonas flava]|uniref:hypothetical protein n=1 Tax=Desertimonas flava TaxID=2064846 RepID=UPI000E350CE2|nr:hypothetical protein [Desertimonas flava]